MRAILAIAGIAFLIAISTNVASSDREPAAREFAVPENAARGLVIGRVHEGAAASSQQATTYTILHAGNAVPFVVDGQTGDLRLADSTLDFEAQSRHAFVVRSRRPRVSDNAHRAYLADLLASDVDPATMDDLLFETAEYPVVVNVSDAPDRPTVSTATLELRVDASGDASSLQIAAEDPDAGDSHTYELIAGAAGRFEIDPQSGRLTWRDPTAAVAGSYPLTVRVTDSSGLSDAATFNVEVVVAAPAVAAVPEVVPSAPVATSEAVESEVAVAPGTTVDDSESEVIASESVVVVPRTTVAVAEPVETEAFVEPEPDTEPEAAPVATSTGAVATPINTAAIDGMSVLPLAGGAGEAAGGGLMLSVLNWLPLVPVLAGLGFSAMWYWRRRQERIAQASQKRFRVVRTAQDAAVAVTAKPASPPIESIDELLEPRLKSLEADHAQQAAVHELMATAFQQASGLATPQAAQPPMPVEPEALEAPATDPPLGDVEPAIEARAEPAEDIAAAFEETAPESEYEPATAMPPESYEELAPVAEAGEVYDGIKPGYGEEPYANPAAEPGYVAEDASIAAELEAAHAADAPIPSTYGYDVEEEELAGGYQGLRLSQSSAPSSLDEPYSSDFGPIETQEPVPADEMSSATLTADEEKLQDLRRQLSDLFGVPADRPRPSAPPVSEEEPVEEDANSEDVHAAIEEAVAESAPPTPPVVVPAASPPVPAHPPVPSAEASDPVNSWLEYLKQRALEKPGSPSGPAAHVPYPTPAVAPATPAPVAAPVEARRNTTPPPVRPNKSAVREEITMLRNLANRHSRNVLARKALNQRARMTWVLWGTALIVLCFSALWGVRHDAGGIRTLGWALLGGAAIALGCCIYGFRCLSRRPAEPMDEEELDDARLSDDLGASTAPDLMTPEMEQRLREVLDEARNVPEAAQSR